jgi:hypothetical protein
VAAEHHNPLADWLRLASTAERKRAAELIGCKTPTYLYQIASSYRGCPSARRAFQMEDAFRIMHDETGGRLPLISARQIAMIASPKGT